MGWTLIGRGRATWGAAFAPDLLQLSGALLLENPMLGVFAKKTAQHFESLRLATLQAEVLAFLKLFHSEARYPNLDGFGLTFAEDILRERCSGSL